MVQTGSNPADTVTVNLTEDDILEQVGNWLLTVLPITADQIVAGQQNQVAAPLGLFVTMTIVGRKRLATNAWIYAATTKQTTTPWQISVQIGVFGPGAGDAIQTLTSLFRDPIAADFFAACGFPIAPLYASDARQTAFISEARQYEDNWNADLNLQVNYVLTTPIQTATSATVGIINVDATYPPE